MLPSTGPSLSDYNTAMYMIMEKAPVRLQHCYLNDNGKTPNMVIGTTAQVVGLGSTLASWKYLKHLN